MSDVTDENKQQKHKHRGFSELFTSVLTRI